MRLLRHCGEFKPYDIWFLVDTKQFQNRKLVLGRCPKCLVDVAELQETRISDGKIFVDKAVGFKNVQKVSDKVRHQISITRQEITIEKNKPFGFVFGINKEKINTDGSSVITQTSCDFYGQKEIIAKKTLNSY